MKLAQPKKGTTMETVGKPQTLYRAPRRRPGAASPRNLGRNPHPRTSAGQTPGGKGKGFGSRV